MGDGRGLIQRYHHSLDPRPMSAAPFQPAELRQLCAGVAAGSVASRDLEAALRDVPSPAVLADLAEEFVSDVGVIKCIATVLRVKEELQSPKALAMAGTGLWLAGANEEATEFAELCIRKQGGRILGLQLL